MLDYVDQLELGEVTPCWWVGTGAWVRWGGGALTAPRAQSSHDYLCMVLPTLASPCLAPSLDRYAPTMTECTSSIRVRRSLCVLFQYGDIAQCMGTVTYGVGCSLWVGVWWSSPDVRIGMGWGRCPLSTDACHVVGWGWIDRKAKKSVIGTNPFLSGVGKEPYLCPGMSSRGWGVRSHTQFHPHTQILQTTKIHPRTMP